MSGMCTSHDVVSLISRQDLDKTKQNNTHTKKKTVGREEGSRMSWREMRLLLIPLLSACI